MRVAAGEPAGQRQRSSTDAAFPRPLPFTLPPHPLLLLLKPAPAVQPPAPQTCCPTPLQLVDERGNFREDNFDKMRAVRFYSCLLICNSDLLKTRGQL